MITDIIKPITLLRGHHADTGQTGGGCAMDVIAYLNGDKKITDRSPCVCVTVRPFLIYLNDLLPDSQRHLLIPYIERAMGSRTSRRTIIQQRLSRILAFAESIKDSFPSYSEDSIKFVAKYSRKYAVSPVSDPAMVKKNAWASKDLTVALYVLLDDLLPRPEHDDAIIERAHQLVAIAEANHA